MSVLNYQPNLKSYLIFNIFATYTDYISSKERERQKTCFNLFETPCIAAFDTAFNLMNLLFHQNKEIINLIKIFISVQVTTHLIYVQILNQWINQVNMNQFKFMHLIFQMNEKKKKKMCFYKMYCANVLKNNYMKQ